MSKRMNLWVGATALAGLFSAVPQAALAQSITTSPFTAAAPTLGTWMLMVLVGLLTFAAVRTMRPGAMRLGAGISGALLVAAVATTGQAVPSGTIFISGEECFEQTTHEFESYNEPLVINECPNAQIVDDVDYGGNTEARCESGEGAGGGNGNYPICQDGTVLQPGESCRLYDLCS